jgi:hypothetical protein
MMDSSTKNTQDYLFSNFMKIGLDEYGECSGHPKGPWKKSTDQRNILGLKLTSSLVGHNHPLKTRAYLESLESENCFLTQDMESTLQNQLNEFFNFFKKNGSDIEIPDQFDLVVEDLLGRVPQFFPQISDVNYKINSIFPIKGTYNPVSDLLDIDFKTITYWQFHFTQELVRYYQEGPFYIKNGRIDQISQWIDKFFGENILHYGLVLHFDSTAKRSNSVEGSHIKQSSFYALPLSLFESDIEFLAGQLLEG